MEPNDFKVRIIDFYKDVDKPLINNIYNDDSTKNILELSTINNVSLLKKNRNNWMIKDKRNILKEIETIQKSKVKEMKTNLLNNTRDINITNLKESNTKLISELESIDNFKKKIEDEEIYTRIKNLTSLSNNKTKIKSKKQKGGNINDFSIKIIDLPQTQKIQQHELIKLNIGKIIENSDSDDFIEIYSNSN